MKNIIRVGGRAVLAPGLMLILLGMGATPPGEIPSPKKDFRASIVDTDGISSSVTEFSFHGEVFLDGERGKALVAIPFERIARLEFSPEGNGGAEGEEPGDEAGETMSVTVHLRDGTSTTITVPASSKWYGKTRYGNMVIQSGDIESIDIAP